MATYKTKGIILRRSNFSEADRLITILTEDRGKIRVLAKGFNDYICVIIVILGDNNM